MTNFRIPKNATLNNATFAFTATNQGQTDGANISTYGNPPAEVPTDFFPTSFTIEAVNGDIDQQVYARRGVTVDLTSLGDADTVACSNLRRLSDGTPVGSIKQKGTRKAVIWLNDLAAAEPLIFDYTAVKAGAVNIIGTGVITVSPQLSTMYHGWGIARYYLLAQDSNKRMLVQPGRTHRKVYLSTSGITFDQLTTELGGTVSASGSISFSGQPEVNSTVTINGTVFTFVASGAFSLQCNIGANLAATMTNLAALLNNDSNAANARAATYVAGAAAITIIHETLGTSGATFTLATSSSPASNGTRSGATLTGGSAGTAFRDNVAAVGLGGDGVLRYGEGSAVALDPIAGSILWGGITGNSFKTTSTMHSNWMLLKRGDVFPYYFYPNSVAGGPGWGESPLHPVFYGVYGSGARPQVPRMPRIDGQYRNVIIQDWEGYESGKETLFKGCDFVMVNGVKTYKEISPQGVGYNLRGYTASANISLDGPLLSADLSRAGNNGGSRIDGINWHDKDNKTSGMWAAKMDGLLVIDCFLDHNGWRDGYYVDTRYTGPYPPEIYSHGLYIDAVAQNVSVQRNMVTRPAFSACQLRPGGFVRDNLFAGSNSGMFCARGAPFGGVIDPRLSGQHSTAHNNVTTWGAKKDALWAPDVPFANVPGLGLQNLQTQKARGMTINGDGSAFIDNLVVNGDGLGTPITDTTQTGPRGTTNSANSLSRPWGVENGATVYDDNTLVYDWCGHPNAYATSVNPVLAADATLAKYNDAWKSVTGSTNDDFCENMRLESEAWTLRQDVIDFFQTAFGIYSAPRAVSTTLVFWPDEGVSTGPGKKLGGRTAGQNADEPLDWSTGDIPGTVSGDAIDLNGYTVHFSYNPANTLGALNLNSGTMKLHGGLIQPSSIGTTAGNIDIDWSGEFRIDGSTSGSAVTIGVEGGRFMNTGTWSRAANIKVSGQAECLLGYDSASWTVGTGSTMRLEGGLCNVGWDGSLAQAASLTVSGAGTLLMTAAPAMVVNNMKRPDGTVGGEVIDFTHEATITGQTDGATAEVADWFRTDASTCTLMLKNISGVFVAGEDLHATNRSSKTFLPWGTGYIAQVSGTPTYVLPTIKEFRSGINGPAAPNVVSTFTCGGNLVVDARGVANGAYDLVIADTVSGTFASVTGQTSASQGGVVSYTGTKVILTITSSATGLVT